MAETASTTTTSPPSSLPSPALLKVLPPPPGDEILTAEQWKTMLAICEPSIPSLRSIVGTPEYEKTVARIQQFAPPGTDRDVIEAYLVESAVELPRFKEGLRRVLAKSVPQQRLNELKFVLNALNTSAGSLLLTGYRAPVASLSLEARSLIVANWASSYVATLRTLNRTFNGLTKKVWANVSPTMAPVLGYDPTPPSLPRVESYAFKFHDFADAPTNIKLSTDVVITGSGCGAGVVASHLARAGLKVLVLEKAYNFSSSFYPMPTAEGFENLFEAGGTLISEDSSTVVVAGSSFGGGGTVNWSASLQLPAHVRSEWIHRNGLSQLAAPEFQDSIDYVCERMGVAKSTDSAALAKIRHNFANRSLLEGARKLGLPAIIVPQNTGGKEHWCGSCCFGCSSCTKQGPANNWLPDAAEHGAEFIEGCFVEKILWSPHDRRQATGVLCTWTSRDQTITKTLTINAARVIVSSGALHSPLVLQRSGITNRHLGRNLHLHPASAVVATWPERVNPWEGPILTTAVTALSTLDGLQHGAHGPVVECLCATPAFSSLFRPFRITNTSKGEGPLGPARAFKETMATWSHSTAYIVIQRDRDSGSVFADPDDPRRVRLNYTASHRDRVGLSAGSILAARMAYVQGAREIDSLIPEIPVWVRTETLPPPSSPSPSSLDDDAYDDEARLKAVNDASFEAWIRVVETKGVATKKFDAAQIGSAHQMGTCRIGKDRDSGVVDVRGRVWGTNNVWVADASVFPTASGVNPMVTTMALAEWISRGIVREARAQARSRL